MERILEDYDKKFQDAMSQIYEEYDKAYQKGVSDALNQKGIEKDPKYLGVPNINFSLGYNQENEDEYRSQRLERGFDDSELWALDNTIANFVYPRLKEFSKNIVSVPIGLTEQEWADKLDKMIKSFELVIADDWKTPEEFQKQEDEIKLGLKLFCEHFSDLWQ